MSILSEAEYILTDQDKRKYTLSNVHELLNASAFKNLVCQLTLPIYKITIGLLIPYNMYVGSFFVSQKQNLHNSCEALIGSMKRGTIIILQNDLRLFTAPNKTVGTY